MYVSPEKSLFRGEIARHPTTIVPSVTPDHKQIPVRVPLMPLVTSVVGKPEGAPFCSQKTETTFSPESQLTLTPSAIRRMQRCVIPLNFAPSVIATLVDKFADSHSSPAASAVLGISHKATKKITAYRKGTVTGVCQASCFQRKGLSSGYRQSLHVRAGAWITSKRLNRQTTRDRPIESGVFP